MGTILMVFPFNLKLEKREQYAKWLKENEETVRQFTSACGGTYRGTYLSSFGLAPSDGILLAEFSSYEDFDVWREANDPKFTKVMNEMQTLAERCPIPTQVYEQTPDGLKPVVVRKHTGKRPP